MSKQRDSNIELLRIIAMIMIVAYHLVSNGLLKLNGYGTYDVWKNGSLINKIVAASLFPGGYIGNMIFFMITGYFLAGSYKVRSFKKIVMNTIFYSSLLSLAFILLKYLFKKTLYNYGGGSAMISSFILPVTGGRNWFATAYIVLLLLIPVINKFLDMLNKNGFLILLLVFNVFVTGIGYFLNVPFYDLYIAFFYYICGVYLKKFVIQNVRRHSCSLFFSLFLWGISCVIIYLYFIFSVQGLSLYSNISILIFRIIFAPLCAFCFFTFMALLNIRESRIVNKISGTTFAVYLIHGSVFQRIIWDNIFKVNSFQYSSTLFPFLCLLDTVVIFLFCSLIDFIKQFVLKKIKISVVNIDKMKEIFLEKENDN